MGSEIRSDLNCCLAELGKMGGFSFPTSESDNEDAFSEVLVKRKRFYAELAALFSEAKVYYPGCGADPVPYKYFGKNVVYGSLREVDYFGFLRNIDPKGPAVYAEEIKKTRGLDKLVGIYSDFKRSAFKPKSFDVIVMYDFPGDFSKEISIELKRLMVPGGILVYEDDSDLENQFVWVEGLKQEGFKLHKLDRYGGLTGVGYYYRIGSKNDPGGRVCGVGLSQEDFVELMMEGADVYMAGHVVRVLQNEA